MRFIDAEISELLDETNLALQHAAVSTEINLVRTLYLDDTYNYVTNRETLNVSSSSLLTIAYDPDVQQARDESGADLVSLLTTGGGGIAFTPGVYSATGRNNFGVYTFVRNE